MIKLIISIDDISRLSSFDGNIDNDSINPFIFMAQNSEIKISKPKKKMRKSVSISTTPI